MSKRFTFALYGFVLMMASFTSAQDAKGWFEEYCDGDTFHLTKFTGQREAGEFRFWLRIPTPGPSFRFYPTDSHWFDAMLCPSDGHCDETAEVKMQFQERRKHVLLGRYVIDFKEGHREGSFVVKERFRKHPMHICE
jgi:hypothetical protein